MSRTTDRPPPTRRRAVLVCAASAAAALACTCLMSAAVLLPAPIAVFPFVVAICVAAPIVAAHELLLSIAVLRGVRRRPDDGDALDELRRHLERLPETHHPLGY